MTNGHLEVRAADLTGRVALVTGSSRGIESTVASLFAAGSYL